MDSAKFLIAVIGLIASIVMFWLTRFPRYRRKQFRHYGAFSVTASLLAAFSVFVFCLLQLIVQPAWQPEKSIFQNANFPTPAILTSSKSRRRVMASGNCSGPLSPRSRTAVRSRRPYNDGIACEQEIPAPRATVTFGLSRLVHPG